MGSTWINADLYFSCVLNLRGVNWAAVTWNARLGSKRKPVKKCTYKELENATFRFSVANRLGNGAFGEVYRGVLRDKCVAVKARNNAASPASYDQFDTEITILTNLEHPNIISLLGYCKEGQKQLIVYEFMPKGSLKDLKPNNKHLLWHVIMEIAVGVAEALNYLHNAKPPIVHGDLKDSIVLLDDDYNPKLSGFGISRFVDDDIKDSKNSKAWDIHEFGKILFQLISGRESVFLINNRVQDIVPWAHELLDKIDEESECYDELIDQELKMICPKDIVLAVGWLARKCTHENIEERPAIDSLLVHLKMLEDSTIKFWSNFGKRC